MLVLWWLSFVSLTGRARALDSATHAGGLHLPIYKTPGKGLAKRAGQAAATGLGDVLDVTYTVVVRVGDTETPLVIDTGSSDLWLVSDQCSTRCVKAGVPLYAHSTWVPAGQDVQLLYGDSRTGTHAIGPIGTDTVGIAGLSIPGQYFAAILDTNTTVLETGSAGIIGLGFPPISVIWRQLLVANFTRTVPTWTKRTERNGMAPVSKQFTYSGSAHTIGPQHFNLDALQTIDPADTNRRDFTPFTSVVDTFPTFGPLLTRLITTGILAKPLVVVTLQRDTLSVGGQAGMMSLGALPSSVDENGITWAPVRGYLPKDGGIPPPPQWPDEVYPLVWEIPLDDVYFDGVKLPRSRLAPSSISLSALLDTGNSLIRGPQDVVAHIFERIGSPTFPCSAPHNLSFLIRGRHFPVDPRDFIHPVTIAERPGTLYANEIATCTPALAATDAPGHGGFMYSWSLGDPFLKSALVAFYYGNMTQPSLDPPRVGLISTVPTNAADALAQAVDAAVAAGGIFASKTDPAPTPMRYDGQVNRGELPAWAAHVDSGSSAAQAVGWGVLCMSVALMCVIHVYV